MTDETTPFASDDATESVVLPEPLDEEEPVAPATSAEDDAVARAVRNMASLDEGDTADEPLPAEPAPEGEGPSFVDDAPTDEAADAAFESLDAADDADQPADEEQEDGEAGGNPFAAAGGVVVDAHRQIREGINAFKSVREASQRHSDAREALRAIQELLDAHTHELKHRIEIEERFPQIVAEQTAELEEARQLAVDSLARAEDLDAERADLESKLTILKTKNEDELRPYRNVAESTKGRADDTARALADARRQTKSAESALNDATRRRDQAIAAANRTVDNAQERLRKLQGELEAARAGAVDAEGEEPDAAVTRLQNELTTEQAHLESARRDVATVTEERRASVESAQQRVFDQKKVLAQAERDAEAAKKEANARRSEYDTKFKAAQEAERALSDTIKQNRTAADLARKERTEAEERIEIAQELLDEAQQIHATPQDTIALRDQISREQADLDNQQDAVDELATSERELRKHTFKQRLILVIAAAVAIVIIIAIIVVLVTHR